MVGADSGSVIPGEARWVFTALYEAKQILTAPLLMVARASTVSPNGSRAPPLCDGVAP